MLAKILANDLRRSLVTQSRWVKFSEDVFRGPLLTRQVAVPPQILEPAIATT
jgi:hypothetical protein